MSMAESIELSVVVPAYNEEERICENLIKIADELDILKVRYEIICVNDGSVDKTYAEIMRAATINSSIKPVSYEPNGGKGKAVKTGIEKAQGEYIAFLDADLDIAPSHIGKYLSKMKLEDADIAIGSKMHPESVLEYPFTRKVISVGYYVILKILFHLNTHDTQTGVKVFKGELIKKVIKDVTTSGFAFDIEILAIASLYDAKIIEMPVTINFTRDKGFSRIGIADVIKVFRDTIYIKKHVAEIRKSMKRKA